MPPCGITETLSDVESVRVVHTPTEVIFGKEVEKETGETAKKYGNKALIVFGKGSVIKSGLL